MWRSYKDYRYSDKLETLYPAMKADFEDWMKSHNIRKDSINVFRYEYPKAEHQFADSWWALPLAQGGKMVENEWQRTSAIVKTLPGMFQCIINFIEPHGGLPMHRDMGSWSRIEEALGKQVRGWTIGIGIDMPSQNPKELAIKFFDDDIPTCYGNGEIVCFDGRNHLHEVWNKTNEWRVSAVIDLNDEEFNNVVG